MQNFSSSFTYYNTVLSALFFLLPKSAFYLLGKFRELAKPFVVWDRFFGQSNR